MQGSCLYDLTVMHRRLADFGHRLEYRLTGFLLDIDELPALSRRLRLFGHNRRALWRFDDADHGPRDGTPLRPWVERLVAAHGVTAKLGRIRFYCLPRLLGYAFNPISVFFCEDQQGRPAAAICQVHNTYHEQHAYVLKLDADARTHRARADKQMYVSPFIEMDCRYHFRFAFPGERLGFAIHQTAGDKPVLFAGVKGPRRALDDRALFRAFLAMPLMTCKVMAGIHWEALLIWLKNGRRHFAHAPKGGDGVSAGIAEDTT